MCEFHRVPVYELYIILPIFTFLHTLGLVFIYVIIYDVFYYFNQFMITISPFYTIFNACT